MVFVLSILSKIYTLHSLFYNQELFPKSSSFEKPLIGQSSPAILHHHENPIDVYARCSPHLWLAYCTLCFQLTNDASSFAPRMFLLVVVFSLFCSLKRPPGTFCRRRAWFSVVSTSSVFSALCHPARPDPTGVMLHVSLSLLKRGWKSDRSSSLSRGQVRGAGAGGLLCTGFSCSREMNFSRQLPRRRRCWVSRWRELARYWTQ